MEIWVGSYFYILVFLYKKNSYVLLFVVFLVVKGNKKLIKKSLFQTVTKVKLFQFMIKKSF